MILLSAFTLTSVMHNLFFGKRTKRLQCLFIELLSINSIFNDDTENHSSR